MNWSTDSLHELITNWLGGGTLANWASALVVLFLTGGMLWVIWRVLDRFRKRLHANIDKEDTKFPPAFVIQDQTILTQREIARFFHKGINWIWFAVRIGLVLMFLNLIFSQFDWSREWAIKIIVFCLDILKMIVQGVIDYLPNLVVIIFIVLISKMIIRILHTVFEGIRLERIQIPGFYPEWSHTSFALTRLLVIALTIIVIFPYLPGSDSPAFQGLSIFVGVLLSLGSTSAIANIISGIVITFTRAFKIGDRVRISDTEGDVVERSAFVTRILTPKNEEVAIPNAMVMNHHIVNFSTQAKEAGVLLHTTVTIGYDVPWTRVHRLLKEAAEKTENLMNEPEPFVLQTSLDDNYVAYELNAYTRKPSGKQKIYSDLHAHIQDSFRDGDVEILSPHYRAMRDGNEITIPKKLAKESVQAKVEKKESIEKLENLENSENKEKIENKEKKQKKEKKEDNENKGDKGS